jgi:peptide/nickel transport system ATP-binding protein
MSERDDPILSITDLEVRYHVRHGSVSAVRGVDLHVAVGETLAIVGESGSGKSTTAHAVAGLLPPAAEVTSGRIEFAGQDLRGLGERRLRALRGREIGLIPQDPTVSLNPVKRIGEQVAEVLRIHGLANRRDAQVAAVEALAAAGLSDPAARARQYPHELSGGMRQRVLIAIALAASPRLVIADEPTSALDVTVQRQILDHIERLTDELGTSVLLITHDLGIAAERADRIAVMSQGRIVEVGVPAQILGDPQDPYTRALIAAAPSLGTDRPTLVDRVRPRTEPVDGLLGRPGSNRPLVVAEGLVKEFPLPHAADGARSLRAVDDVSFAIDRGRTFALVGESGSGKSTTARLVLRLTDVSAGRVLFDGDDITRRRGHDLRMLRRRMQLVYQNPFTSLNPRFSIAQVIADPLRSFGVGSSSERRARAVELVDRVALPSSVLDRKPGELSGGQRQRVAIARALALNPDLVVLDEPVSALDVSIQQQILELLVGLQVDLGLTYLFISHDLAVVRQIAHDVGVVRDGALVEHGPTAQIFDDPYHDYTRELLAAIPGRSAFSTVATPNPDHLHPTTPRSIT